MAAKDMMGMELHSGMEATMRENENRTIHSRMESSVTTRMYRTEWLIMSCELIAKQAGAHIYRGVTGRLLLQ